MKISKIENKINIEDQFDVELQATYYCNTEWGYWYIYGRSGIKCRAGEQTTAEIRAIKKEYGIYCFRGA